MPHDHSHHHLDETASDNRVLWAVVVNVVLTFAQVAGGAIAGSMALIADGVHNFSDAAALVIDLATAALTYALSKHSLNIRAAFLHNLADAGASVAVIIGGVVILLYDWRLVDPILTIGISVFILWHVFTDLKPVLRILMLGAPPEKDCTEVRVALGAVEGVESVHHVHLWQIDERRISVEAHLVLAEGQDYAPVIARAKGMLAHRFDIHHATLEPESAVLGCADHPAH
ncbi:hypothetical protein BMI90_13140 [Thioclava sp. L04-15]|uniref:cation diffusion facilitator family transporter n=1 Tax=Thioclava sp. L04-15 TaxID=1915318 RepID=UPI0009982BFB|nr:cation diffusion facilitator family transporter [Thioclava sp. L04-15]OOY27534.1 hypothetical protein BMI90_13140 [Thioclava sp. L04-15]TNE89464.1 MAG: cation transporter [Paracoccaceae bacterium]